MKAKNVRKLVISTISFLFVMTLFAGCASPISENTMERNKQFTGQAVSNLVIGVVSSEQAKTEADKTDTLTAATLAAQEREAAENVDTTSGATGESSDPNNDGVDTTSGATGEPSNPGTGGVDTTTGATGSGSGDDEHDDDEHDDDEHDDDEEDEPYHKKEDKDDEEDEEDEEDDA